MRNYTSAQGIHNSIAARMNDPEWARIYTQVFVKLNSGFYDPQWVNVIFQNDRRIDLTIFDAAIFAEVYVAIQHGLIAHTSLPIGCTPRGDMASDENNSRLPNGTYKNQWIKPGEERDIEVVFKSLFDGGNAYTDGEISYSGELPFFITIGTENKTMWLGDQSFKLEVGYCRSDQLLFGLAQSRNLVRWPYGSNELVFMSVIEPKLWCAILPHHTKQHSLSLDEWSNIPKSQLTMFGDD